MSIRPSAVLRLVLGGALGLPLILLVLSDATPVPCYLAKLITPDVAGLASKHVREITSGTLDFRDLSIEYDMICIVDVDEPGQLSGPSHIDPRSSRLVGHRICGGWERNSAWFALIKKRNSEQSFAIMHRRFTGIPSDPQLTTVSGCAPTKAAVARCVDRGRSGVRCSFNP